jgi:secondary thiamine-phosphate synthase enzyme
MRQDFKELTIQTSSARGFYDITKKVVNFVSSSGIESGLITLYIKHTSASLLINENYDPDVLVDMETFFFQHHPRWIQSNDSYS